MKLEKVEVAFFAENGVRYCQCTVGIIVILTEMVKWLKSRSCCKLQVSTSRNLAVQWAIPSLAAVVAASNSLAVPRTGVRLLRDQNAGTFWH